MAAVTDQLGDQTDCVIARSSSDCSSVVSGHSTLSQDLVALEERLSPRPRTRVLADAATNCSPAASDHSTLSDDLVALEERLAQRQLDDTLSRLGEQPDLHTDLSSDAATDCSSVVSYHSERSADLIALEERPPPRFRTKVMRGCECCTEPAREADPVTFPDRDGQEHSQLRDIAAEPSTHGAMKPMTSGDRSSSPRLTKGSPAPESSSYGRSALEYIDPSPSDIEAINLRIDQQEQLRQCTTSVSSRQSSRLATSRGKAKQQSSRYNKRFKDGSVKARVDSVCPPRARPFLRSASLSSRSSSASPPPATTSRSHHAPPLSQDDAHVAAQSMLSAAFVDTSNLTRRIARADAYIDKQLAIIKAQEKSTAAAAARHEQTREKLTVLQDSLLQLSEVVTSDRAASAAREHRLAIDNAVLETQVRADVTLQQQLRCEVDRLHMLLVAGQAQGPETSTGQSVEQDCKLQDTMHVNKQLHERVAELERSLVIARSAASAATTAAQRARKSSSSAADNLSEHERIDPQALRQSILALQEQLQDSDAKVEQLQSEVANANETIREKDIELAWLRDVKDLNGHEILDLIDMLSQPQPDLTALKAAAIRMRTNLHMAAAIRPGPSSSTPSQAQTGWTGMASPKVAQLAAALTNWRGVSRSSTSVSALKVHGLGVETPHKEAAKTVSYPYGSWTPPASERAKDAITTNQMPLAGLERSGAKKPDSFGISGDNQSPSKRTRSSLSALSRDKNARLGTCNDTDEAGLAKAMGS